MTADQKYADILLSWWAKWVRGYISGGYPSITIEGRLAKEGAIIRSTGKPEEENEPAEKVEQIVSKMLPKMKKVVKVEYLTYTTRKEKQRRLKMGRYEYEQILREAQSKVVYEYDS